VKFYVAQPFTAGKAGIGRLTSLLSGGFSFLKLLKELRNRLIFAVHPGVNAWATENFGAPRRERLGY
jgi:hypothetical protein